MRELAKRFRPSASWRLDGFYPSADRGIDGKFAVPILPELDPAHLHGLSFGCIARSRRGTYAGDVTRIPCKRLHSFTRSTWSWPVIGNSDSAMARIFWLLASRVSAGCVAPLELLDLDAPLYALANEDDSRAQLIEMRYFGGMTAEETAEALGSIHIVRHDLQLAQAWLSRRWSK